MAIRRRDLIAPERPGFYHLISRCARRAFQCGVDETSGQCFKQRRDWIEQRILALAEILNSACHFILPLEKYPLRFLFIATAPEANPLLTHLITLTTCSICSTWRFNRIVTEPGTLLIWTRLNDLVSNSSSLSTVIFSRLTVRCLIVS